MTPPTTGIFAAIAGAIILAFSHASVGNPAGEPDNAATDYLAAYAAMDLNWVAADTDTVAFAEKELYLLPASSLKTRPRLAALLRNDLMPGGAADKLLSGCRKSKCSFSADWDAQAKTVVSQLLTPEMQMRHLAIRACAMAKCAEYDGDAVRAAEIYAAAMAVGAHLAQTPLQISGLFGAAISNRAADAMVTFLNSAPSLEATAALSAAFNRLPIDRFNLVDTARGEFKFQRKYFDELARSRNAEEFEEFIKLDLDGIYTQEDANSLLALFTQEDFEVLMTRWGEEYNGKSAALLEIVRLPYTKALPLLQSEARVAALRPADVRQWNPLIQMNAPRFLKECNALVLAKARSDMVKVLCAATMYRREKGEFPENVELLKTYFPGGLPRDPFAGQDFIYCLRSGMPHIECEAPDKKNEGARCFFDVSYVPE